MEKTTSSRLKLKLFKQSSFELKKPKSVDDWTYRNRCKSYREDTTLRKTHSFDLKRTRRPYRVLYKARSKTMIKLTLSPESPEKRFQEFYLDIKEAKESPKDLDSKSYRFFVDSSTLQCGVPAVVVAKDGGKEEKVEVKNLLDIRKAQLLQYKTMKKNLTASPVELNLPELRTFDNATGFLCTEETEFQKKRKMYIKQALQTLLKQDIDTNEVPHIALMGSGGGYRAMVAMSGVFNALFDTGILDYILYVAALSGSSWYISTLYSHKEWPSVDPRQIQKKMKTDITSNPKILPNVLYYGFDFFKKKFYGQEWNFTTDVFASMLGKVLIGDRLDSKWSDQAKNVNEGTIPLPLLAAIHAKTKENAKRFHEWVEFSPYEVSIPKYGAAISMKKFGSEFTKGILEKENQEIPLYEIMGICGSAFTMTFEEYENKDSTNFKKITKENKTKLTNYDKCDSESDIDFKDGSSQMKGDNESNFKVLDEFPNKSKLERNLDVLDESPDESNNEYSFDVLDGFATDCRKYSNLNSHGNGAKDDSSEIVEEELISSESVDLESMNNEEEDDEWNHPVKHEAPSGDELEDLFDQICSIREKDGHVLRKTETETRDNPIIDMRREMNVSDDVFSGVDELDGFIPCPTLFKEMIMEDRTYFSKAALVNNFLRKLSFDDPRGDLLTDADNALFEKYLANDLEKLCLIDAGLAFNSPYPLLFQQGRDIDLILSFDFTDRKKDSNAPFQTLLTAEQWAKQHGIKFPKIDVEKYEGKNIQEVYVFEDDNDLDCPVIMHFVLVNENFRRYTKPGVKRNKDEEDFANFDIYDDQKTFHCTNFAYNKDNFNRLSQLSEFIVLNNKEIIHDCIKKSVRNKQSRLNLRSRMRHKSGPM